MRYPFNVEFCLFFFCFCSKLFWGRICKLAYSCSRIGSKILLRLKPWSNDGLILSMFYAINREYLHGARISILFSGGKKLALTQENQINIFKPLWNFFLLRRQTVCTSNREKGEKGGINISLFTLGSLRLWLTFACSLS